MTSKAASQSRLLPAVKTSSVIKIGVVALLYIAFYAPMFPPLVREWYEHENFSYGFLIPLIFLYLIWEERGRLAKLPVESSGWGIVSLVLALLIGLVGKLVGEPFLYRASFVLTLAALIHLFLGRRWVRALAFPIGYLFLMVPPPYVIVKEVSYYLRMSDAVIATNLLQMAGVPVYNDAYYLHLPAITLEVADVCSGIASLFAMAALGTIYAYYLPARFSAKLAVLGGTLVLPLIANIFRIFLVGYSVYHYGPIMLGAFYHRFTGTFTFLLSLLMLVFLGEYLRRRYPLQISGEEGSRSDDSVSKNQESDRWQRGPFAGALSVLILAIALSTVALSEPDLPLPDLNEMPEQLGPFRAKKTFWPDAYADPNSDTSISRVYSASPGHPVELFIGYKRSQLGENRLWSPKLIFPKGWEYAAMEDVDIETVGAPPLHSIQLITKKGAEKRAVLYWYQVRGLAFAGDLRNRIESLLGLLRRRPDGAVVRIATPIAQGESGEQAKRRLVSFAASVRREIGHVLPH